MPKKKVLKIIIMGWGSCGKTTLKGALVGKNEFRDRKPKSTSSVEFGRTTAMRNPGGNKSDLVELCFRDVGSAAMNRDQLFWDAIFNSADICCVCYDPADENGRDHLQNGVRFLKERNFPANKIILVSTKDPITNPKNPVNEIADQLTATEKLGGSVRTNALQGEGVSELRQRIITHSDQNELRQNRIMLSEQSVHVSLSTGRFEVPVPAPSVARPPVQYADKFKFWQKKIKTLPPKLSDFHKLKQLLEEYIGKNCLQRFWTQKRHHRVLLRTFLDNNKESINKTMSQLLLELLNTIPDQTRLNGNGDLFNLIQAQINAANGTAQTEVQNKLLRLKV